MNLKIYGHKMIAIRYHNSNMIYIDYNLYQLLFTIRIHKLQFQIICSDH